MARRAKVSDDHRCAWRDEAERLQVRVTDLEGKLAAKSSEVDDLAGKLTAIATAMEALERRVLGPKSEKMPPPEKELRKEESAEEKEARRQGALERRRERAAMREKLRAETVIHHLDDDQRECTKCGGTADRDLPSKETQLYEYVPGHFVRQRHVQEKAACRCGEFIATADAPMLLMEILTSIVMSTTNPYVKSVTISAGELRIRNPYTIVESPRSSARR